LVIRGDRCTGKTQLLNRLQQKPFEDDYTATEQINIAHINWDYKGIIGKTDCFFCVVF
jgi:GTPase SAR1 family protein